MKFDFDKALSFPFEIEKEEIEKDFLKWSHSIEPYKHPHLE